MKVCIEKLSDESLYCFVCMVCILRVDIDVIYKTKYNKIYIDTNWMKDPKVFGLIYTAYP